MAVPLLILIILVLLNSFFAASEMALVGLNDSKIKRMAEEGDKKAKMLHNLISEPGRFLSTIQIGITLAGFLASAFAGDFFAEPLAIALQNLGIPLSLNVLSTLSLIAVTILLSYFTLVFGELVPKQLALKNPEPIAKVAAAPLTILFKVCSPIVKFLTFSTNTVIRLFGVDPNAKNNEATEEEIRMLIDVGSEQGTIQLTEHKMINNIFEFNDKTVSDIVTHRTDMSVLPINATLEETIELVNIDKYTRYPIYEGDIDNIVGILHIKDLLQYINKSNTEDFNLKDLVKKPYFVLETQSVDVLFTFMQKNNAHIAIVLDEYGGTEGLVTIEDVIEEIVGEISSETEGPEEEEIRQLDEHSYLVKGITHLYKLEDILHVEFPTEEYDTLNGFLISQLGYFPEFGDKPLITYKNITFEATGIEENRIETVKITVGQPAGNE